MAKSDPVAWHRSAMLAPEAPPGQASGQTGGDAAFGPLPDAARAG